MANTLVPSTFVFQITYYSMLPMSTVLLKRPSKNVSDYDKYVHHN